MSKYKYAIACAALWLGATSASAANIGDGNELLANCQEAERVLDNTNANADMLMAGLCIGLVDGVKNTMSFFSSREGGPQTYCEPPSMTNGQAIRVVLKYLRANPEQLHRSRIALIIVSLVLAYPCKK